jgi:hypothetical protein
MSPWERLRLDQGVAEAWPQIKEMTHGKAEPYRALIRRVKEAADFFPAKTILPTLMFLRRFLMLKTSTMKLLPGRHMD